MDKDIYVVKLISKDTKDEELVDIEAISADEARNEVISKYPAFSLEGEPKIKLLLSHLKNNRDILMKLAESSALLEHSVNLGTAREGIIANFLKQNLPENIAYHSGELFNQRNERSGQLDIILHPITSPKIHLYSTINLFPVETVLAVIEVKSNLTTDKECKSHLEYALKSCEKVKRFQDKDGVTLDIPFIVFSYKGAKYDTLVKKLEEKEEKQYLPDLIIVLEKGYFLKKIQAGESSPPKNSKKTPDGMYWAVKSEKYVLLGMFQYLLQLVEKWFIKPEEHSMPISKYTEALADSIYINDAEW